MADDTVNPNTPVQGDGSDVRPTIYFKRRGVQPPSALYVTTDDTIVTQIFTPTNNITVSVSLRYLNEKGEIISEFYQFAATSAGAFPQSFNIPGAEGFLLSASVSAPTLQRGFCFVSMVLKRGLGASDLTLGDVVMQGYVPPFGALGFPQSPVEKGVDGRGAMRSIATTVPGAGADWTITVPVNVQWVLRGVVATLTTAVAVANRLPVLRIQDSVPNNLVLSPVGQVVAASLVANCSWFNGAFASVSVFADTGGLPAEIRCPAGFIISSSTQNIQAADQWTAARLLVEEFINA